MNKLLLLTFAACVVSSLSAQPGITFSLSNPKGTPPTGTGWTAGRGPGRVLTVKKSDPRAVEMFSFEVVDASGNVKCTYYRIDENRIAPVIDGDATEWRTQPFLGNTTADMVLSVRNPKVTFVGDDNPIVKKRDAALMAGRKFDVWQAVGELRDAQDEQKK